MVRSNVLGTPWRIGHVHSFQCTSSFKVHGMYNAPEAPSPEGMQLDGGTRTPNTRFPKRRKNNVTGCGYPAVLRRKACLKGRSKKCVSVELGHVGLK
jgi:hypothetical protein